MRPKYTVLYAVVILLPATGAIGAVNTERADDLVGQAESAPPVSAPARDVTLANNANPKDSDSDSGLPVTDKEREALALVQRWREARDNPVLCENGQVRFLFGATMPVIVCAPLRGTDIALEPGETVKPDGVHTGDTVRWQVMPSVSGPVGNETTHLIVKPTDVGLSTNMIVGTDRRTYHFELVSRRDEWMPSVGFTYPEKLQAEWTAYHRKAELTRAANTITDTGENIAELDFSYRIEGGAAWKPVRVYNNGSKTVVQMPKSMKAAEAPALLVVGDHGAEQIVNYRVHGDRYVVDSVFDTAVLVMGVGRSQTKVTITRVR